MATSLQPKSARGRLGSRVFARPAQAKTRQQLRFRRPRARVQAFCAFPNPPWVWPASCIARRMRTWRELSTREAPVRPIPAYQPSGADIEPARAGREAGAPGREPQAGAEIVRPDQFWSTDRRLDGGPRRRSGGAVVAASSRPAGVGIGRRQQPPNRLSLEPGRSCDHPRTGGRVGCSVARPYRRIGLGRRAGRAPAKPPARARRALAEVTLSQSRGKHPPPLGFLRTDVQGPRLAFKTIQFCPRARCPSAPTGS